jgi:hypothetical protein
MRPPRKRASALASQPLTSRGSGPAVPVKRQQDHREAAEFAANAPQKRWRVGPGWQRAGCSGVSIRSELEYRYRHDGTRRYIKVLMVLTEYPEVEVKAAVERCVQRRAFSADAVLNVLRNEPLPPRGRLDLSDRPDLMCLSSADGTTGNGRNSPQMLPRKSRRVGPGWERVNGSGPCMWL